MTSGFVAGEQQWRARLSTLRQVVRQELVARQLAGHLAGAGPQRVLDVGCGQGTQLVRLARLGHEVTGLDSSATLLGDLRRDLAGEPDEVRARVRVVQGDARDLAGVFEPGSFEVVLCHGVLMYFADPGPLLDGLARVVAPGGMVSLLVRNGDALAMRAGLLGDWDSALRAFDHVSYGNRLGVAARADRVDDLVASLAGRGLSVRAWYGVRLFTDVAPDDAGLPDKRELAALLACEERAATTDPYRRVAALTHLIAERTQPAIQPSDHPQTHPALRPTGPPRA
ncbi:methyltransferase domain-containing protein [Nonomuraea sp. NPDC050310]|uniref:methyltransferase domain-containing protein n=1 Tax=Nonomuraea sp. NPDC050310 TaxID=3154935 RepID=UPI0033D3C3F5